MKNYININGKIFPEEKALISIKDRGFRFGDGVFETCLIRNGAVYNFEAHLKRLNEGLKAIKILPTLSSQVLSSSSQRKLGSTSTPSSLVDPSFRWDDGVGSLDGEAKKLIRKNKIKNGYLRISISRGVGSVGYLPEKNIAPTIVIETLPEKPKPKFPIKLCVSKYTKPSLKSLPVNYKLMNSLNSTLVRLEAEENKCFDAIILNDKNQICETSSANIFWIKDEILYTPHPNCGILLGTIREKILKLSPIKTKLVKAKLSDLLNADEAFITNIAIGVLAIDKITNREFKNKKYSKIFSNLLNQDIKNYEMDRSA